jgi:D-sedoheptulose 7-phosphate isomerase
VAATPIRIGGNSQTVIRAVEQVQCQDVKTLGWLSKSGGALRDLVDMALVIPSSNTQKVQEVHITVGYRSCEILAGRALAISITGAARQGDI